MRRYSIVILGVALLFAIAAVAQADYGSSGQSSTSTNSAQQGKTKTVEGCIVREEQDYYIYPVSGQPQHISSTGQDVSGHVGHHVKLQGTSVPASSPSASASGGTSGAASSAASNQPSSSGTSGSMASNTAGTSASGGQEFAVAEVDMVSESCPSSIKQKAAAAGMSTSPAK
jgi:hypothetical protein